MVQSGQACGDGLKTGHPGDVSEYQNVSLRSVIKSNRITVGHV